MLLKFVGVFTPPPHSVFHQPVLGVINKDCIQAECLYSSQIQHLNCEGTGACQLPTQHQLPTLL